MHQPCTKHAYALCLLLAACAAPVPETAPAVAGRIVPAENGLEVEGTGLEIGFGRYFDGAVAAVSRFEGPPVSIKRGQCATVRWASGLEMFFFDNSFEGWAKDGQSSGGGCAVPVF